MKKIFTRLALVAILCGFFVPDLNAVSLPGNNLPTEPDSATVKAAVTDFLNLSKKEKKAKFKEVKKAVKEYKAQKKAAEPLASTLVQVIFAILLPPLGVYLHEGEINNRFWISLLLTLLFFLPGVIYALVIVLGD